MTWRQGRETLDPVWQNFLSSFSSSSSMALGESLPNVRVRKRLLEWNSWEMEPFLNCMQEWSLSSVAPAAPLGFGKKNLHWLRTLSWLVGNRDDSLSLSVSAFQDWWDKWGTATKIIGIAKGSGSDWLLFRPCFDIVGFTLIHMCWGGLEWNLN